MQRKIVCVLSTLLAVSSIVYAAEFRFDKQVDPTFQVLAKETLARQPSFSKTIPLTIAHIRDGQVYRIERSTIQVVNPATKTQSSTEHSRFYSRIFFGRDTFYKGTPYENSIFVTASGPDSLSYDLVVSSDLQNWKDGMLGGSGLFLLHIEQQRYGEKYFFRFVERKNW